MKKVGSLALALALCLGLAVPAAAADTARAGTGNTISTGGNITAAVTADGSLWMWGLNDEGQLGNGGVGNDVYGPSERSIQTVPVRVMGDVVSVSCGTHHAAAIKTDGSLWTWGWGVDGALADGIGDYDHHVVRPQKVMDGVAAVSCGTNDTAILKTDGSLWMCGYNNYGEFGNGVPEQAVTTPIKVMDGVAAVSCEGSVTAILKQDGSLWMCGLNLTGQIGNGGGGNDICLVSYKYEWPIQTVPVRVLDDVQYVHCGSAHVAAIKNDGSLWMWGANGASQLGRDGGNDVRIHYGYNDIVLDETPIQTVPIRVLEDVATVACGSGYTMAVRYDGSLWNCGNDQDGRLGNGDAYGQSTFTKVMDGVAAVSGSGNALALKTDGTLMSWGPNLYGQVGNGHWGYGQSVQAPVQVLTGLAVPELPSPPVAGFQDVRERDYFADAVVWAKERGVTSGTSATTFSPAATVTRAEAVTFLWRAAGSPQPASATSPFADVTDAGAYYYDAVLWAAEQGITGGVGNGQFGLDGTLTYDQILAMLCRAAGETAAGSDWSAAAVSWAAANGLTDGLTVSAKGSCPRADVVYCLWKQLAQ